MSQILEELIGAIWKLGFIAGILLLAVVIAVVGMAVAGAVFGLVWIAVGLL